VVENEKMEGRRTSPPTRAEYEDEVELIDYLRVLWKYRFWIIGATILSAFSALAISFILPPIWEVSMVVLSALFFLPSGR
jgi:LPS O-antigen subunit length determinant protein (WzzB/FepE family)